jgi:hypothetical protein
MNNPYVKETRYVDYLEEKNYENEWVDVEDMCVEVLGFALILCTVSTSVGAHGNIASLPNFNKY